MDHLPGVDPDPELQLVGLEAEPRPDLLDRAQQRQPGPHGTLRVVVAAAGSAEDRHRGIPDELLQHPAIALGSSRASR